MFAHFTLQKCMLGDSILCPGCKRIVGTRMTSDNEAFVDNSHQQIAFYRICVSLEDLKSDETLDKLTYATLVGKLLRQLIAYKFQIRLVLLSVSCSSLNRLLILNFIHLTEIREILFSKFSLCNNGNFRCILFRILLLMFSFYG